MEVVEAKKPAATRFRHSSGRSKGLSNVPCGVWERCIAAAWSHGRL